MTKDKLVELLEDIKLRVAAGDSFGGNLHFDAMAEHCGFGEFEVSGMYRIGNLQGQGGVRIIEPTKVKRMMTVCRCGNTEFVTNTFSGDFTAKTICSKCSTDIQLATVREVEVPV